MNIASSSQDIQSSPQETRSSRHFQDKLIIFLFLLPSISIFLVFVIYPIFQSIYYSLFNWKGFGPAVDFVALDNYKRILTDRVFILALQQWDHHRRALPGSATALIPGIGGHGRT